MSGASEGVARPFHEWHEDLGPVLWWLWPIGEAPYVGTPLDLGRTVSFDVTVQIGVDMYEVAPKSVGMTGGWPWQDADDDTETRLFWTPLPCASGLDTAIRDHIRGGPDPMTDYAASLTPPPSRSYAEGVEDVVNLCRQWSEPGVKVLSSMSGLTDAEHEIAQRTAVGIAEAAAGLLSQGGGK